MRIKELKEKTNEELQDMLKDCRNKVREYNFKIAISQIKNVRDLRKNKKTIAKILTILNQTKK